MKGLIILDRDGVINEMVLNPDHGLVDSPMNPREVVVPSSVVEAMARLSEGGYRLAIATNQPGAAKGKTTKSLLMSVHERVLELLARGGVNVDSSHICWHRAEDGCECRKPQPGLLQEAVQRHGIGKDQELWMVGDGFTDIQAGAAVGARTVFVGPQKCDMCLCFERVNVHPHFWEKNLSSWVTSFLGESRRKEN